MISIRFSLSFLWRIFSPPKSLFGIRSCFNAVCVILFFIARFACGLATRQTSQVSSSNAAQSEVWGSEVFSSSFVIQDLLFNSRFIILRMEQSRREFS